MQSKRTFIALKVKVQSDFLHHITAIQKKLGDEQIKWVDPQLFHLTLHFIGNTSISLLQSIDRELKHLVPSFGQQKITIRGLGVFPSVKKAKVLWADLQYGNQLLELQQAVTQLMKAHNLPVEERDFRPHLTLGRVKKLKDPARLALLIDRFKNVIFSDQLIKEVIFYESRLSRSGPFYQPLHTYPLGSDGL